MKVAVAGYSGFVGTTIVRNLRSSNYDVKMIGKEDINSSDSLLQDRFGDCEWIVNCAGVVKPCKQAGWTANTDLPARIYESFCQTRMRGFIQVSSVAAVRSISSTNEIIDDRSNEIPDNDYGRSKLEGDQNLIAVGKPDAGICILRPPMLYGKGASGVFDILKRCSIAGLPMPFKNLENLRSVMFVENFGAAVIAAIDADLRGKFITVDHDPVSPATLYDSMTVQAQKGKRTFSLGALTKPLLKIGLGSRSSSILENSIYSDRFFREETGFKPPFGFDEAITKTMGNDSGPHY